MAIHEEVETLLTKAIASLGNSLDDVINTIVSNRITGIPKDAARCPIANYIRRQFQACSVAHLFVSVDALDIRVYYSCDNEHAYDTQTPTPACVQKYIHLFDGCAADNPNQRVLTAPVS